LPGKAHKRALEAVQPPLPFPLIELRPGNGSGFINRDTANWRGAAKTLMLTRSRPRHKNGNCSAGRKNSAAVRNYAGCARFDTGKELSALAGACKPLRPFLNILLSGEKTSEQNFHRFQD
jgi:hypothetical protein